MNHYSAWLDLRIQHPRLYARDIAALMNITEAELTYARVGHDAVRLEAPARELLEALAAVGEIKCICRNPYAVHEQVGRVENMYLDAPAGMILNPGALDLRIFLQQWASFFALTEASERGEQQSIQCFDIQGDAIVKIYATAHTNHTSWQAVIDRYAAADNAALVLSKATSSLTIELNNSAEVEREWRAMTDSLQFSALLKRHNLTRQQAFRLVSTDLACRIDNRAVAWLLDEVKSEHNAIMIFVSNRGCIQIHTGTIDQVVEMGNWLNIFNPQFTLHLQTFSIAESWIIRKPVADDFVTSLELFAADGTLIAQLYGQRSKGQPEQSVWRTQIDALIARSQAT